MTIPEVAHGEHIFWERIDDAREVIRVIGDRTVRFFVQPTRLDCLHACTVDDVTRLLACLPGADWEGIEAVLLRQPRRKEQMLAPVWGRLAYAADLAEKSGHVVYSGPAIVLEAVNPNAPIKFGRSLPPTGIDELERLRSDGHGIKSDKFHTVQSTLESCRATQLYRTLLHELGHWVDFLEKVERPSSASASGSFEALLDRFHNRPSQEKEQFAHCYADRMRMRLIEMGAIPFNREFDPERLKHDRLSLEDFVVA